MNIGKKICLFQRFILCFFLCFMITQSVSLVLASDTIPVTIRGKFDYQKSYEVLRYTNAIRKEKGLPALKMDADLLEAAMQRAAEISLTFSHYRPDRSMCFTAEPSKMLGENIALGQKSAKEVVTAWKNSPSHYENIMDSHYRTVGIGCFSYDGVLYWAQAFGSVSYRKATKLENRVESVSVLLNRKFAEDYIYLSSAKGTRLKLGERTKFGIYFYSTKHNYESFAPIELLPNDFEISNQRPAVVSVMQNQVIQAIGVGKGILQLRSRQHSSVQKQLVFRVSHSNTRKIRLYAVGGTFGLHSSEKVKTISVINKKPYGALPVPVRRGYRFKGWYTAKNGGTRITPSKLVSIHNGKTQKLYARWSKISVNNTSILKISGLSSSVGISITWKQVPEASGYEVILSSTSSFDKGTTKKLLVKGSCHTSCSFKGLRNGKRYYVKVRAFQKDLHNKKIYGRYSAIKTKKLHVSITRSAKNNSR